MIIRILTAVSLSGLLFAVGLRLTWREVREALWRSHLSWLLPVNFIVVPLVALALIRGLHLSTATGVGMMLLAAAPFAPVVPVFARIARADLALAAGLTALFPFIAAFLTPLICVLGLRAIPGAEAMRFSVLTILVVLLATITCPLSAGVVIRRLFPRFSMAILRPVEIFSEAAGAISLAFVTFVEFGSIVEIGPKAIGAMVIASEIGMAIGYALSGPTVGVRRVTALGTSNRNIALALLVAVQTFAQTPVVGAVVGNGLVLILLGLLHVGWWRLTSPQPSASVAPR